MDRDDWLYLGGGLLMAVGAGLYSPPAFPIVIGVMLAAPPLISLFRENRKGPENK